MNTILKICTILVMIAGVQHVVARPSNRIRRTSDQHMADVETRIGLNRLNGISVTVPLGMGHVDPNRIGRKRRSQSRILDALFNHSAEDDTGELSELNYDDIWYSYRLNDLL